MSATSHARIRRLSRVAAFAAVLVATAACSPDGASTGSPSPARSAPASASAGAQVTGRASARATDPGSPAASPGGPGSPGPSASASAGTARFDPSGVELVTDVVVDGLDAPVDVTSARDGSGRLFVVEQPGRIRIVKDGKLAETAFLDITDRIASGGERGLLGLAFHPEYSTEQRFFVDYTNLDGDTIISEFRVAAGHPDQADPS